MYKNVNKITISKKFKSKNKNKDIGNTFKKTKNKLLCIKVNLLINK